ANGWVGTTANRLLTEGAGRSVADAVQAKATQARTAYGRMQALWVLHNLGELDDDLLVAAARGPDGVVRKNTMRIAGERDNSSKAPPPELVRAMLGDSDLRVRINALVA